MLTSSTPFIASEEFYLSPEILSSTFSSAAHSEPALHIIPPPTLSKLKNLGPSRIRDMRSSAVSQQILSHVPIDVPSKTCRKINDALHANTVMNQDRFAKLALLPCGDVAEAARELQRCVTKYKFVGGVLGFGRKDGRGNWAEWEEEGLEELWKVAERYKVPVKLSPLFPRSNEVSEYEGSFPGPLVGPLVTYFHSFPTTSPLLLVRLYLSGAFDRHPNLRLMISQNGHSIPSLVPRIESIFSVLPSTSRPTRSFLDVWQYNIYVTTADILNLASMRALLEQTPVDRLLFAGNYPWEERGRGFMEELKDSGIVGREEWEKIAWRNAENLFRVK